MRTLIVGLMVLFTLTACNTVHGTVYGKSDGQVPEVCPMSLKNWSLSIKTGPEGATHTGVCVTEEDWARYQVGDPYP